MPEKQTDGDSRPKTRRFAVDFCYDPQNPESCTQEMVYKEVGTDILGSMFEGYNACVLAYGHSASGKTYTMMGEGEEVGLAPRICKGLFEKMKERTTSNKVHFQTVISFLEIYNERVRDLLMSDETGQASGNFSLRVREHPKLGPYVQDLTEHNVREEEKLLELLALGNSRRSTAATENNLHSSRSHAVFTIRFKQSDEDIFETDKTSKLHLVDLAGSLQDTNQQQQQAQTTKAKSERANSVQSKTRLKEGANINKSLVTLGNVISALAESCELGSGIKDTSSKTWQPFVPYRDSVLTWLLKDTLGGNSNTVMIATISPGSSCFNETINTLRYAKRTKRIVNQPIINEDPKVKTIRELREEVLKLKNMLLSFRICRPDLDPLTDLTQIDANAIEEMISSENSFSKWLDPAGTQITNDTNDQQQDDRETAQRSIVGEKKQPKPNSGNFERQSNFSSNNNARILEESGGETTCSLDVLQTTDQEDGNGEIQKSTPRIVIETPSSSSLVSGVSKINDEKKTDVNGLVIDRIPHESQVFSDSLESFSFLHRKSLNNSDCDLSELDFSEADQRRHSFNYFPEREPRKKRFNSHKIHQIGQSSFNKSGATPKKELSRKVKLYLSREFNSCENLSGRELHRMLHRSRPDLIKGISTRSQDGLPSTSSQSYTDVSVLSQSTSENSLNSSGSVDSQPSDARSVKNWSDKNSTQQGSSRVKQLERTKTRTGNPSSKTGTGEASSAKPASRKSSIGDVSGSSTPTQTSKVVPKKKENKRSEIVAAVTTRLYATKKKPDPRLEALQAADKDEDDEDDGELEELKLCKRARMKLFDLSRKLAMTKRVRKTVDSNTQTEFVGGTVRVKEKCVVTDQQGVLQFENCATNTPPDENLKEKKDTPSVIMNQVFIPQSANYIVECGKGVRVEIPGSKPMPPPTQDLGTQTKTEKKKKPRKNLNASPIKRIINCKSECYSPFSYQNEDSFSDDSLDLEPSKNKEDVEGEHLEVDLPRRRGYLYKNPGIKYHSNENLYREVLYFDNPLWRQVMENRHLYHRSFDSLLDSKRQELLGKRIEKSALPIARYPICGTNILYEYDPNKSIPDKVIYSNLGENSSCESSLVIRDRIPEIIYPQYDPSDVPSSISSERDPKIALTEVQVTLFNGLPLAICSESVSSSENMSEDAIHVITTNVNNFLSPSPRTEENASSENSFVSNDGSDVTSSSETSSEDFVFYENPNKEKEMNRSARELYTISENSEQSDHNSSASSSPQRSEDSSLTVLETEPVSTKVNENPKKHKQKQSANETQTDFPVPQPETWEKTEDVIYFEEALPDGRNEEVNDDSKGTEGNEERVEENESGFYLGQPLRYPNVPSEGAFLEPQNLVIEGGSHLEQEPTSPKTGFSLTSELFHGGESQEKTSVILLPQEIFPKADLEIVPENRFNPAVLEVENHSSTEVQNNELHSESGTKETSPELENDLPSPDVNGSSGIVSEDAPAEAVPEKPTERPEKHSIFTPTIEDITIPEETNEGNSPIDEIQNQTDPQQHLQIPEEETVKCSGIERTKEMENSVDETSGMVTEDAAITQEMIESLERSSGMFSLEEDETLVEEPRVRSRGSDQESRDDSFGDSGNEKNDSEECNKYYEEVTTESVVSTMPIKLDEELNAEEPPKIINPVVDLLSNSMPEKVQYRMNPTMDLLSGFERDPSRSEESLEGSSSGDTLPKEETSPYDSRKTENASSDISTILVNDNHNLKEEVKNDCTASGKETFQNSSKTDTIEDHYKDVPCPVIDNRIGNVNSRYENTYSLPVSLESASDAIKQSGKNSTSIPVPNVEPEIIHSPQNLKISLSDLVPNEKERSADSTIVHTTQLNSPNPIEATSTVPFVVDGSSLVMINQKKPVIVYTTETEAGKPQKMFFKMAQPPETQPPPPPQKQNNDTYDGTLYGVKPPDLPKTGVIQIRNAGDAGSDAKIKQVQIKINQNGEKNKKINWSDVQPTLQRQFLNFNILSSSRQNPFSIDSHFFGDAAKKEQSSEASQDSITFVFMGPSRQRTSVLMEIIKRSLGQNSSSEMSAPEKRLAKKSKSKGVQCNSKLMRSVSVDTAMFALSKFAKHQRPTSSMGRTTSLDTLVPEEMQMILEQGRLHNVRESSCQCNFEDLNLNENADQKPPCTCQTKPVLKYTTSTLTTRDQQTETTYESCESTTQTFKEDTMRTCESQTLYDADSIQITESVSLPLNNIPDQPPQDDAQTPIGTKKAPEKDHSDRQWERFQGMVGSVVGIPVDFDLENDSNKKSVSWSDLSASEDPQEHKRDEETESNERLPVEPNESSSTSSEYLKTTTVPLATNRSDMEVYNDDFSAPHFELGCYSSWSEEATSIRKEDPYYPRTSIGNQPSSLDSSSQTRRVRFSEPQRWSLADICQIFQKKDVTQNSENMSAFLKEATALLKNLNQVSKMYGVAEKSREPSIESNDDEKTLSGVRSPLGYYTPLRKPKPSTTIKDETHRISRVKVESAMQTEVETFNQRIQTGKEKHSDTSSETSPIRKPTLSERRQKKVTLNLTWPRRRPNNTAAKPPTGLKFNSPRTIRSPLPPRPHSSHTTPGEVEGIRNNLSCSRISSCSTNWNASNLSTTFSNSYFGDSAYSRPSSTRSIYSEANRPTSRDNDNYKSNESLLYKYVCRTPTGATSPRSPSFQKLEVDSAIDMELHLEESCRRLELAVEQDRVRQENLANRIASFNDTDHHSDSQISSLENVSESSRSGSEKKSTASGKSKYRRNSQNEEETTTRNKWTLTEDSPTYLRPLGTRSKPPTCFIRDRACKCYCHRFNLKFFNKKFRSCLELESLVSGAKHCHVCCIPCSGDDPNRYFSAPVLTSTEPGDSTKCRVSCYDYCSFCSVRVRHARTSPRAYMQHLLSLRRQIVDASKMAEITNKR